MTYEQLKTHVMTFFGDTSRTKASTKHWLNALADECQMLAESIRVDDDEFGEDDGTWV